MTRSAFSYQSQIGLDRLLLDTKNPRIRAGTDQADCIERLLRKPKQLLALAKDIATNGLSTAPILVEPVKGKKFVVWDGNRRVTALKLLNDPSLCKNKAWQAQFAGVASKAAVPVPAAIDVLSSPDRAALLKEVLARHAGALDGAGQLNWDALLRTMFLLGHKAPTDYRLSGLLLMWAEEHGIEVDDSFPITTIHRFLNKKNLARLGFTVGDEAVESKIDADVSVRIVERLVQDFGPAGSVDVNAVFTDTLQDKYIDGLLADLGLATPDPAPKPGDTGKGGPGAGGGAGGEGSPGKGEDEPGTRGRPTKPKVSRKADWDRKTIVRGSYKPQIPDAMWKADEVLKELRRLETERFPISVAALFRVFFELSTKVYMKRHKLTLVPEMHKNALTAALRMRQHGSIDQGEHEAANRRFKDRSQSEALLQYATLNDYMHSFKHMPDRQSLHVLWVEVQPYLEACWDESRRPD